MQNSVLPSDLTRLVGTADYYKARHLDFARRHPEQQPPTYYLDYGDRYMHRFVDEVRPAMDARGQDWILKTRAQLQRAIEAQRARDPEGFERLEQDTEGFLDFCYQTHPQAYLDSGIHQLNPLQWLHIALTPDSKDLLTCRGVRQVGQTVAGLVGIYLAPALLRPREDKTYSQGVSQEAGSAQDFRRALCRRAESLALACTPTLETVRWALWNVMTRPRG